MLPIDDELRLIVQDDGVGIAPDVIAGVGLTSMRERAEELGGTFYITQRQPQGTHLQVTLPRFEETNNKIGTQNND